MWWSDTTNTITKLIKCIFAGFGIVICSNLISHFHLYRHAIIGMFVVFIMLMFILYIGYTMIYSFLYDRWG